MDDNGPIPGRLILGVPVAPLRRDEAIAEMAERISSRQFTRVTWLNAHNANLACENSEFRSVLQDFLVLPDGIGVDIASKLLHGTPFPANLNGTDFTPALLQALQQPLRIGLIGARPEVVKRAAAKFRELAPQHEYRIISDGFFTPADEPRLSQALQDFAPHILLVAMGVPRQELFMARMLGPQHCILAFGVGALFDFMGGAVPRAPAHIQRLRLEWAYRLMQEPRRLWRRYIVGNPLFLIRVLQAKLKGVKWVQ
ncbi:WecB/TagA/CpsF family glycosyltransferase [Phyllobacterium sp. 21LDTY02-6]|uniref:WecB/TagA/CpsF family glycosyltransferase n=1 Tax=Phyllobacterium sp. 21LDTY02-6 TaxID=2944903 RepID=UPI0020213E19|nr:WecB/TagA/CpsF family glycosyltransferase [Phyllobacterium sp. 21LDTY02-6]MCO4318738.1 WecB/TagA/CpsF family glycosyltransferase [Phyllobacterium sp. 21LDTY02-6]